ncbi:ArsR/SmtB family transcription factor [Parasediminibacterium sp. JCM 36343]|uniref:ArsR/SmtB family transcription factor n=1 Tax=Parasediminibacterium sp. JCM 36343 TaxID=3374279 RepID=UPI003978A0AE
MTQSLTTLSLTNGEITVKLDFAQTKKTAAILRALNHKLRQQMLKLLNDQKKMTVTEMYVKLRIEQSVASQHLAILRRANLVSTKRDGKFIFYAVNYARLEEVNKFIKDLVA